MPLKLNIFHVLKCLSLCFATFYSFFIPMAKIVVLCPTRVLVDPLLYYDMESRIGNVTDYSGQRLQNATLEELDKMAHAIITKINSVYSNSANFFELNGSAAQFQLDSVEIKKNFKDCNDLKIGCESSSSYEFLFQASDLGEPDNQAFCQNIVISSRSFSDENPSGNNTEHRSYGRAAQALQESGGNYSRGICDPRKHGVSTWKIHTNVAFLSFNGKDPRNRAWQQRIGLYGAHEIAHSLSSPHEETYPDSINAEYNCTTGSSLMQHEPKRISEQMSECTKNAISEFLNFAINTYTNCLKIVREVNIL